jgi:hypothetical protein
MTEEKFEKFLEQAAQDYNVPPVRVPREEMWSAIQARRAAGPRVVYGGGFASTSTSAKRFGTRVWLGAAAAAMLLVATGVGIGRWTAAPANQVAANLPVQPVVVAPTEPGASAPSAGSEAGPQGASDVPTQRSGSRSARDTRVVPGLAPSQAPDNRVASGAGITYPQTPSSAYELTTVRHLSEAEALLTSFRGRTNADQQMDAQLGTWARQLLSNTRLLLDSPVANDPQRRPLLQDLELVLVQIVQLSPGAAPQDRELIEKTLQQEHVLTRLRTAIPAGPQRGS